MANSVRSEEREAKDLKQTVRQIREIRKGASLKRLTIRALINKGRRY